MKEQLIVRVRVIVYEDGEEVDRQEVGYYAGQPYRVEINTPDGTDVRIPLKAGGE